MHSRPKLWWAAVRDSLWFVPALTTLLLSAAAILLARAEQSGQITIGQRFAFVAGMESARALLAAVAGGLFTVTGVAFSITVVALQLSSTQFSPRVLPAFMSDRANQIVLGIMIGTFTYCLIVLRLVDGRREDFPHLSVAGAMLLAIVSIAALIFFINHAARSIQIAVILQRATQNALAHVDGLFPEELGEEDPAEAENVIPPDDCAIVRSEQSGYLQALDEKKLFSLGYAAEATILIEQRIGTFVLGGQPLARVWPSTAADEQFTATLRRAFVLAAERSHEQDYELSLIEISDIAVKALSPGINDPTTAQHCIDRLSQLLLELAVRHAPKRIRTDEGRLHVIVRDLPFDVAVKSAFDQVVHFGGDNPAIRDRITERLDTLLDLVPEVRRSPLRTLRDEVLRRAT